MRQQDRIKVKHIKEKTGSKRLRLSQLLSKERRGEGGGGGGGIKQGNSFACKFSTICRLNLAVA